MSGSRRRPDRRGFTLIEAVVVVTIIGLLVALVIPAVQSAREASRRAQCMNHLKQIGIGLAGHHAAYDRFPAGIRPDGRLPSGREVASGPLSAHYQLLPFLEQTPSYNAINLTTDTPRNYVSRPPNLANDPRNRTIALVRVDAFLCPSDRDPFPAGSNYRACSGPNVLYFDSDLPPGGGGGAFQGLTSASARDIRDGLSQTAGFSERIVGSNGAFDSRRDLWFSGVENLGDVSNADEMQAVCSSLSATPTTFRSKTGRRWIEGGYSDTLYNHVAPPNWSGTDCSSNIPGSAENGPISGGAISARSFHPGGVNLLLMDGSVRFVKQGIEVHLWRAIASRSGGESLSGVWD